MAVKRIIKMRVGKGSCNGTFGELIQGVLGERPFLVTLPIPKLISEAIFIPNDSNGLFTGPVSKSKAITACEKLFQRYDVKGGGHLQFRSNIPLGKGMASSSADIVAAIRAAADSHSLLLTEEMISQIACEIEPTDGVMYEGAVAYDYMSGQLIDRFGSLPPFVLIGIDLGGTINTIEFNRLPKSYTSLEQAAFAEAFHLVRRGMKSQNLSFICKAATLSAQINQKRLLKPYFSEFKRLAMKYEGGLVAAHSGTVMGILLKPALVQTDEVRNMIVKQIADIIDDHRLKPLYFSSYN